MAITEKTRHRLYQRLEGVLGPEEAATLMEHLPPVGWADVATKRDLDALARDIERLAGTTTRESDRLATSLGSEIDLRVEAATSAVRADISALRAELHAEMRKLVVAMAGMLTTFSAVAVAAAGLW